MAVWKCATKRDARCIMWSSLLSSYKRSRPNASDCASKSLLSRSVFADWNRRQKNSAGSTRPRLPSAITFESPCTRSRGQAMLDEAQLEAELREAERTGIPAQEIFRELEDLSVEPLAGSF